ncbi:ferredoxin--nitrite reductase [filamentous cyanobacterium LEGE 11480]|uniref:Ferredoxin--nitrite reductase n=1 Tax=Romeriopsis navalis LEGE 11480 TaxID=2777977 RepID=A0A928VQS6_9CYAN|nr:ferredoxin--nitrite reductase [Romeriopsis navalis]MBE9032037.1 ferredoxin--nitrite reductase [Romeriopsis navalis LEGE 11480]
MTSSTPTKLNKFEKYKAEKDGLAVKSELEHFAEIGWEAMDDDDRVHRLKWLGIFYRPVTPNKFMLRMRLPSGIMTSAQSRAFGEVIQRYGEDGCGDVTTRQNIQLRGIRFEDFPEILRRFEAVDMTSIQSGMDNVRNITASPVAGIDGAELLDTRDLVQQVQDLITNKGQGNPAFTNLPRKFNIAIGGCPDNSIHAEINDIAFVPAYKDGVIGFNVVVGGFFSASRVAAAVPMDVWVAPNNDVVALCEAILTLFRDHGSRANRQKSRLMWMIDEWGLDKFRAEVEKFMGKPLARAAATDEVNWDKRDHLGVHPQKQAGLNYVGLHIPAGRMFAEDFFELARLADVYGSGEIRLTVEQNAILINVPDSRVELLKQEPLLEKFQLEPGALMRGMVSCTGAQFCKFAMVETKNQAIELAANLDQELDLPNTVRMHWTGCPNSCGQPQVADLGFMGTKARNKEKKPVPGVDLFMGGKVGHEAHLGTKVMKGIPAEELQPFVRDILMEKFGATLKPGVTITDSTDLKLPEAEPEKQTTVKPAVVIFNKSNQEINCDSSKSLLAIAAEAGISIETSCQAGSCGTCKQRLVEGKVEYPNNEPAALSDAEQAQFVLTCSAHPVGRVILDL